MSRIRDLVVVGGGPAGTTAAITAAQMGFDVVVVEAGKFPRHKVCGEFVSGEALDLLRQLLGSHEMLDQAPRIRTARVLVDGSSLELPLAPAAASISRYGLDLALWNAAARCGVTLHDRVRVAAVRKFGEFFQLGGARGELKARAVINASGRWSNLSHMPHGNQIWIGFKGHFLETGHSDSCDLYFFRGGYCGVQPLGCGLVNVAAMVQPEKAKSLPAVFELHSYLASRSQGWRQAILPISTAPLFFRPPKTSDDGVVFCGDAAAFVDPFAGDGISMALHSGRLGALALGRYLRGECSLENALGIYDRAHQELIQPVLKNAARLRSLLSMPRLLRLAAISALQFPFLARTAVRQTRVRANFSPLGISRLR